MTLPAKLAWPGQARGQSDPQQAWALLPGQDPAAHTSCEGRWLSVPTALVAPTPLQASGSQEEARTAASCMGPRLLSTNAAWRFVTHGYPAGQVALPLKSRNRSLRGDLPKAN